MRTIAPGEAFEPDGSPRHDHVQQNIPGRSTEDGCQLHGANDVQQPAWAWGYKSFREHYWVLGGAVPDVSGYIIIAIDAIYKVWWIVHGYVWLPEATVLSNHCWRLRRWPYPVAKTLPYITFEPGGKVLKSKDSGSRYHHLRSEAPSGAQPWHWNTSIFNRYQQLSTGKSWLRRVVSSTWICGHLTMSGCITVPAFPEAAR